LQFWSFSWDFCLNFQNEKSREQPKNFIRSKIHPLKVYFLETNCKRLCYRCVTCGHTHTDVCCNGHTSNGTLVTTMAFECVPWWSDGDRCVDDLQDHQEVLPMLRWLVWSTLSRLKLVTMPTENVKMDVVWTSF